MSQERTEGREESRPLEAEEKRELETEEGNPT